MEENKRSPSSSSSLEKTFLERRMNKAAATATALALGASGFFVAGCESKNNESDHATSTSEAVATAPAHPTPESKDQTPTPNAIKDNTKPPESLQSPPALENLENDEVIAESLDIYKKQNFNLKVSGVLEHHDYGPVSIAELVELYNTQDVNNPDAPIEKRVPRSQARLYFYAAMATVSDNPYFAHMGGQGSFEDTQKWWEFQDSMTEEERVIHSFKTLAEMLEQIQRIHDSGHTEIARTLIDIISLNDDAAIALSGLIINSSTERDKELEKHHWKVAGEPGKKSIGNIKSMVLRKGFPIGGPNEQDNDAAGIESGYYSGEAITTLPSGREIFDEVRIFCAPGGEDSFMIAAAPRNRDLWEES